MKIAIIGAGFTGLAAAHKLTQKSNEVVVFEKDENPGGLALGFKQEKWQWTLEKHYHHWFTNDKKVLKLAREINYPVITKRPKTSVFIKNRIYQFDSPKDVLTFPLLSLIERLRMGFAIAFLKYNPFWKPLERYRATRVLPKLMGKKPYELIWKSLFHNKFGKFSNIVSLAWFWARIAKRTPSLSYPTGGFLEFAKALTKSVESRGGKFYFNTEVLELTASPKPKIRFHKNNGQQAGVLDFDAVIVTVPSFILLKISPTLPKKYQEQLKLLEHLGAVSLILRLSKPFFRDGTYWLNVCDGKSPVMAIVEHTNFMDRKNYGSEHILYLGNYKTTDDKLFLMDENELLKLYDPYLKKINPDYSKNIVGAQVFKDPFAQPVIPVNYSKIMPSFKTPFDQVYLANIEQVYPWDRGTNYAVELGEKIAEMILA